MMWRVLGSLALAAGLVGVVAGCNDSKTTTLPVVQTQKTFKIVGTIVDQGTRTPLLASVSSCGLGGVQTNMAGCFAFDVPVFASQYTESYAAIQVKIEAAGYATQIHVGYIGNGSGYGPGDAISPDMNRVIDLGYVEMRKGVDVKVLVTKDGAPVGKDYRVLAYLAWPIEIDAEDHVPFGGSPVFNDWMSCFNEIVGVTGADGWATLKNIDPVLTYDYLLPAQDLDGDGRLDITSSSYEHIRVVDQGTTYALAGYTPEPDGEIEIVGDNFLHESFSFYTGPIAPTGDPVVYTSAIGGRDDWDESVSFYYITLTNGTVRLVFEQPVTIMQPTTVGLEPHFSYTENLILPPNSTPTVHSKPVFKVVGVTPTAVNGTLNTVWSFAPNATLPENEVVTLHFFAESEENGGEVRNYDIPFYVPVNNTSIAVKVDNYNGSVASATATGQLYLDFDEVVWGYYKVLKTKTSNTTGTIVTTEYVVPNPSLEYFYNNDDSLVYNHEAATSGSQKKVTGVPGEIVYYGATVGKRYRVSLGSSYINWPDHTAGTPQTITLLLHVVDSQGNVLSTTREFEVQ